MIAENKYVVLHYVGLFEDGQVFDTTINKTPFQFQIGSKQVVPGFENAVREMNVDEEKEVVIPLDIFSLNEHEVLAECGAHEGGGVGAFLYETKNKHDLFFKHFGCYYDTICFARRKA